MAGNIGIIRGRVDASVKRLFQRAAFSPICILVLFLVLGVGAEGHAQTPVSGAITADTHWTLAGSPYQVTDSVTVEQGATLTVDAGVRVEFNQHKALYINGALNAVGTSAQPIRFTGATEGTSGFWCGIYVPSGGSADLEHCTIAYAGYSTWVDSAYRYVGLYKSGSGALTLTNTTLDHSSGAGLQLEGATGAFTSDGNTFSNNAQGIRVAIDTSFQHDDTSTFAGNDYDVYLNGGTMTGEVSWYLNPAYALHLSDSITVNAGAVLHVLPGTVVKAAQHRALFINGTLEAHGDAAKPIAFTDWRDDTAGGDSNGDGDETEPAPGWWCGIYVPGGGSAHLEHCMIAYGGYSIWADNAFRYAGLYKSGSGSLTLTNTTLDHSSGAGLQLEGATGVFTSDGNTFSNNAQGIRVAIDTSFQHDDTSTFADNGYDVYLNGGTMTGDASWYLNPAYAMYLSDHITVAAGAVLHVLPGTVVKAAQNRALFVNGTLEARGEAAKPIAFTDWRDDAVGGDANGDGDETEPAPGWWCGIYVPGGGSAHLEHCTIAYAGYSTWADSAYRYAGLYRSGNGALTLTNTTLDHSSGAGLQLEGATGVLTSDGNAFSNNLQGIRVAIDTSFQHDDTSTFAGNGYDVYLNGGTMTGEASWYLNPAYAMHLSDNITVAAAAVLHVLPGTVVKAAQHRALFINGTLEAVGEAAKPIAFTDWRDDTAGGDANGDGDETEPVPGWWGGIYALGGGSADLEHCTIAYAGYSTWADSAYRYAGLYKSGSGTLVLKNTTLAHSSGAGLHIVTLEGKWLQNGIDGEGDGYLYGAPANDGSTSYFIAPDVYHGDWRNYEELRLSLWSTDGEYYFEDTHTSWRGDIYLANGDMFAYTVLPRRPAATWDLFSISLTDPAVQWILGGGAGSLADVLENVTAFHVRSEYGRGITYAGLDHVELCETPQGAPGIASYFPGNDAENWTIDIGTSLNPAGRGRDGFFTSAGNAFSNNAQGIRVAIDTSFQHDDTSTFTGNDYDVYLNGGTMTGEVFWYLNPAYAMHLSDNITVDAGAVLHVLPGTVVKAAQNRALFVNGILEARGEAAKPITFTDWRDDTAGGDANGDGDETEPAPGWWGGIYVPGSYSAGLEYCMIAYTGSDIFIDGAWRRAGLYKSGSGNLDLKRSTIRESNGSGLYINNSGGSHDFERNTFTANTTGVYIVNQAESVSLSGNLLQGNTDFGLHSQNSAEVDARNNWWGHSSGPQHAELNPGGQGDTVSDGVLFEPWRTTPSAGEILSPIRSGTLVAGDMLRFSGSVASEPDATYSWGFSDGRTFSERILDLIGFPETGSVEVSYSTTPEGGEDPYPDTRSFTVVADTGSLPDLRVTRIDTAGTLAVGQPAQVSYTVRNVGQGPAGSAWKDALYLSRDIYLDIADVFLVSAAVNRDLPAGQSYQNAVDVTLPAVDEGAYNLILVIDDEWQILEQHRQNNEYAAQITAQVPALIDGEAQTIPYAAGLVEQYFQLTASAGQNLVLDLTDVPEGPEVFIRFGALPNTGEYDYRLQGGERFVIPAAAAGQWYILVYGNMAQDGEYVIRFDMAHVALTDSSPSRYGTGTDLELMLTGAGFAHPLGVDLVSGQGTTYGADDVEVDSFSQATAVFAAGTVPAGTYAVRVSRDGQTAQLPDALEIVAGGQPKLEVNLILPSRFGYHQLATVYVEYRNTGDAPMPVPLLMVTAFQNDSQAAILTLDRSRLSSGFWTSAMPEGFAESVQFLASGDAPGILQAGESRSIPVYYAGWQQPWDFSYPPFEWMVGVLDTENDTPVDWAALKDGMRPDYVAEDAWDVVWNNFTALAGSTWGDYVAMLGRNASYLHRHGQQKIEEITALQAFTFRQAEGFSPAAELAGGVDAVAQAPGLPIVFERSYLQQISRRFALGPLGRGWTHNWQFALRTEEDQAVIISDQTGTPRIFEPDSRYTGRFLAQAGDEGDLRVVTGGYRLTEQDGTIQFFSSDGKLTYIEDANGNRITCTYNGDLLTGLTHSAGPALTIDYNGEGRIATVTDPHGRQTEYTYTGEYLSCVTKYDGIATTYSYNTATGASQHALIEVGLPDGNTRTYTYDDCGRLSSAYRNDEKEKVRLLHGGIGRVDVTDALDHTSRFFFDHGGRLFKTENTLGEAIRMDFEESGNLAGVTDPDGFRTSFAYDRQGNLIAATDATHRVTRFTYTRAFNRLASVTDAANNTMAYGYDDRGNLTEKTYPGGNRESWTYDAWGNPVSWTNRRGATVTFEYDAAGRVTRRDFADESSAVYRYDARGNLVEAENSQGTTTFTYNAHDHLMSVAYPGGRWLAFEYDDVGRRTFSEDHLGYRLAYHYDADGRLGRLSNGADDIVSYAYDDLGRLARKTMGNGVYTTYGYDAAGRLLEMANYGPDDGVLSRFAYTYDRRGRRMSMQTSYGLWLYTYDDVGQLTRAVLESADADIPDQDIAYEYDALGNRVRSLINGQDDAYETNSLNQYTRVGGCTYTYDLDGNLIREEGPDGVTVYTYNDQNRLTGITRGGDTWQYAYDALGNRVAVDENGAVTHYVHDPVGLGNVVGEYDDAGNLKARYMHGMGLVSRAATDGTDFYTFDPTGNTSEVSGTEGALQNRYVYRPFGETLLASQAVANPFRFMGECGVMAAPAGLTYARARHYDARVGRFTAKDPLGFRGGGINLYTYAMNSPANAFDSTGLAPTGAHVCRLARGAITFGGGFVSVFVGTALASTGPGVIVSVPVYVEAVQSFWYGVVEIGIEASALAGFLDDNSTHYVKLHEFIEWSPVEEALAAQGYSRSKIKDIRFKLGFLGVGWNTWEILKYVGAEHAYNYFCAYNGKPVSSFGACGTSRSRSSSTRTPQNVGPIRKALSASACMPFIPVVNGESGLASSHDPNQKLGPMGIREENFLRTDSIFSYHIDFENLETATAPAQIVTVRDPLSPHLDLTTFELAQIRFGDVQVDVPAGSKSLDTVVDYDYRDDDYDFAIEVHVKAWLENGGLHVNFISIDPETGLPPQDVGIGFLPPENGTGRGQGFVSCMVKAKSDLPSGTEIRNVADIQFDFGLTIATNQVDPTDPSQGTDPEKEALVTLDSTAPSSQVAALPETVSNRIFTVSWSGEDDDQGSGVGAYEIYVSTDEGPFLNWLTTAETSAVFSGECGRRYAFYSLAVDLVGNVQPQPEGPYVATEVLTITGDADGSGDVDLTDLVWILQIHCQSLGGQPVNICADMDGDGQLGMAEAIHILRLLSF